MKKSYLSLVMMALLVSGIAHAEEYQLPAEVNNTAALSEPSDSAKVQNVVSNSLGIKSSTELAPAPLPKSQLSAESQSSPAVNQITSALQKNPSVQSTGVDSYGRPQSAASQATANEPKDKTDQLYSEAKSRYQQMQNVNVPPGGNIILPVSRGLQNRIQTSFKSASVSTSVSSEDASIFVDGGAIYITTNFDRPIGIMLAEDGVPETTYNLTLIPLDVPGAMIAVNTRLTPNMTAKREKHVDEQETQMLLEKSQSDEMKDPVNTQDDHKQRIIDLLTPVALGEVPNGFSMQTDRLNRISASEQSPCGFNMYAKLGQRLVGSRELIDVVLVHNDKPYGQLVADQQCVKEGVIASAIFEKAFLQPGEETELYIVRDKLLSERKARITTRPSLTK
ncbi:TraK domain-containing protein [Yersinia intermedia]|uniref:TraK domain-containing protein n=1 Tax=Yersinia intermedia TaxID=631 RepID=UPI00069BA396|nr:type-F conjugative transfer system secretin TraK [Yersinia intermedia]